MGQTLKTFAIATLVAVGTSALSAAADANLVQNGGFESLTSGSTN
jgi:hypothetical protein